MPDFPWVKPEEFIHRFGPNIIAIDHRTPIGRWVELGRLDIVYKVSNNETLIFRRRGIRRMPGIDEEVDQIHRPPPPAHFFKGISSQRTAVRQEKNARQENQTALHSSHESRVPSKAPVPRSFLSYSSDDDGNSDSSDFEVNKVTHSRDSHQVSEAAMHPRHRSWLPSMATTSRSSYPTTPSTSRDSNGGSSDIEVSEVMDRPGFMKYASNDSHANMVPRSRSSNFSHSPSMVAVDTWAPVASEASPSRSLSLSGSDLQPSSPPGGPRSSLPTTPEPSDDHTNIPASRLLPLQPSCPSPSISRPKKDLPWHHGLYCIDVVDGFEKMGSKSLKGLSKMERFDVAFPGRCYADSTIRDAQNQWVRASNSAKEASLAAGRTTQGLWRVFSAQHPIKKSKC